MPEASTMFQARPADATRVVFTCTGGLSWEHRDTLPDEIERHMAQNPEFTGVVLDLSAVSFVNSAGLGALFQLVARLRARQRRLVFASVPPLVARMFFAVGMDRLAGIAGDVPAALGQLAAPPSPCRSQDSPPS